MLGIEDLDRADLMSTVAEAEAALRALLSTADRGQILRQGAPTGELPTARLPGSGGKEGPQSLVQHHRGAVAVELRAVLAGVAAAVIDLIEAETAQAAHNAVEQLGGALRGRVEPIYERLCPRRRGCGRWRLRRWCP